MSFSANVQAESDTLYKKRQWSGANNGSMNISAFVFRDINRNGRYDLGDIPFSAIAAQMVKPDNIIISKRSNIAGFANFNASQSNIDADINGAGLNHDQTLHPATSVNRQSVQQGRK